MRRLAGAEDPPCNCGYHGVSPEASSTLTVDTSGDPIGIEQDPLGPGPAPSPSTDWSRVRSEAGDGAQRRRHPRSQGRRRQTEEEQDDGTLEVLMEHVCGMTRIPVRTDTGDQMAALRQGVSSKFLWTDDTYLEVYSRPRRQWLQLDHEGYIIPWAQIRLRTRDPLDIPVGATVESLETPSPVLSASRPESTS